MIKRLYIFIYLIFIVINNAQSQCPSSSFNVGADYCILQNIELTNTSTNSNFFTWDYCAGDLLVSPSAENVDTLLAYSGLREIEIIEVESEGVFVFGVAENNRLYRAYYPNGFNSQPQRTDFINPNSSLSTPRGLAYIKQGDTHFLLVANSDGSIVRFNFGISLTSSNPSSDFVAGLNGLAGLRGLELIQVADTLIAVVVGVGLNNTQLSILDFGTDILNSPLQNTYSVPGASGMTDISLIQDCNVWYGLTGGFRNDQMNKLFFGSDLNTLDSVQSFSGILNPYGIELQWEKGNYYGLVSSESGSFYRINLSDFTISGTESIENLGDFGLLQASTSLDMVNHNDTTYVLVGGFSNRRLTLLTFDNNCSSTYSNFNEVDPVFYYNVSGTHLVELETVDLSGSISRSYSTVNISNELSPQGEVVLDTAYCIADNIVFDFNSTDEISSYNWDFGDGNTSTSASPLHQYAVEGKYYVSSVIESSAGCTNSFHKTLNILPEAQPNISTNSTEYCTFEPVAFTNTTSFNYRSNVSWNWNFNGEGSSTEQNANFTFTTSGTKTIILEANVLGCINTFQTTITIINGPAVEFSYNKNCLNEAIQFTNLSTGSNITGYKWDFGNGEMSTLKNPQITYTNPGSYGVVLTVSNSNGCENSTTQNIHTFEQIVDSIYSTEATENLPFKVGIDWVNDFYSNQNISFQWDVDGEVQTTDTAIYTLGQGTYTVNLEVTTENRCLFNAQRSIEVTLSTYPSPRFNLPVKVCLEEQFQVENTSVNSSTYEWGFCDADLSSSSLNISELVSSVLSIPVGTSLLKFNDQWYGFISNLSNSSITRLDFGTSLNNTSPTVTNLRNYGGQLSQPQDIKAIEEDGEVFLFISNRSTNKFIRINVGADINNASPTTDVLLSGNQDVINNTIDVLYDGQDWVAIYTSSNFLRLIQLGSSPANIPAATDIMATSAIVGINGIGGISLINEQGKWHAITSGYSSKTIVRLDFGTSIFSEPTSTDITPAELSSQIPRQVNIVKEGVSIYTFISTGGGDLIRLDFQTSILNAFAFNNLSNYGVLVNNTKMDIAFDQSNYVGLSTEPVTNKLFLVGFPNNCEASVEYSQEANTAISFSSPGTYPITLTATHPNGSQASITKEITVTNNIAPELSITSSSIEACIGNAITFEGTSPEAITNWQWSFGNGDSAFVQSPTYSFDTPGTYQIITEGISDNGCKNLAIQEVTIYEPPVVSFSKSTQGTFCSQKPIDFFNTTSLPTNATFSWDFGDGTTSTEENPSHTFAAAGEYTINLDVEMAGCLSSTSQLITVNP
ncbi:MAG: PKD repeat protein, partial [Parvicella sp.]